MKSVPALPVMVLALLPLQVVAHAHLAGVEPADGSVLTAPPTSFLLKFSEAAYLTALNLRREGDASARKIGPLPAVASTSFSITAPKLGAGSYNLSYRVVAADDHHLSSGTIRFRLVIAP